jgi:hypothetical protein
VCASKASTQPKQSRLIAYRLALLLRDSTTAIAKRVDGDNVPMSRRMEGVEEKDAVGLLPSFGGR